jgi:4,5-DOPA dioxygenase extradiol
MIAGSGNVVHNLRRLDARRPDDGLDRARRFDEVAAALMVSDPGAIGRLTSHPDYAAAVPTDDHFVPLLYLAGVAAAAGDPASTLVGGYALGSLSMSSYTIGFDGSWRSPAASSPFKGSAPFFIFRGCGHCVCGGDRRSCRRRPQVPGYGHLVDKVDEVR